MAEWLQERLGQEAQRVGIAHAKANGDARTYKGRKLSYSRKQFDNARAMLGKSTSVGEVARIRRLTRQTVYRIKDDPAAAAVALATWGSATRNPPPPCMKRPSHLNSSSSRAPVFCGRLLQKCSCREDN